MTVATSLGRIGLAVALYLMGAFQVVLTSALLATITNRASIVCPPGMSRRCAQRARSSFPRDESTGTRRGCSGPLWSGPKAGVSGSD
jgi:hypothetical protein